jgi:hypothetical protein
MQHFKALRTFFLLLVIIFVIFGCATNKNQIHDESIGLSAEIVENGIRLSFDYIPDDTARIFIHIQTLISDDEYNIGPNDFITSFTDIRDYLLLEQIKQTGTVVFPFVRDGYYYFIGVVFENKYFEKLLDWGQASIVAQNGIYLTNNSQLRLNDNYSGFSLYSEPIFSSEVIFDTQKFSFSFRVNYECPEIDLGSISIGDHHFPGGLSSDGLTFIFEPYWTNTIREGNYLEPGIYPAIGTAYANIIYNNIKWSVQIAQTSEFNYSL